MSEKEIEQKVVQYLEALPEYFLTFEAQVLLQELLAEYRLAVREKEVLGLAGSWWLSEGKHKFNGAPAWVFEARELLDDR